LTIFVSNPESSTFQCWCENKETLHNIGNCPILDIGLLLYTLSYLGRVSSVVVRTSNTFCSCPFLKASSELWYGLGTEKAYGLGRAICSEQTASFCDEIDTFLWKSATKSAPSNIQLLAPAELWIWMPFR
jgi:hypothetical protein